MREIVDQLVEEMKKMPVIDSHEHLPAEGEVIANPADVLTRIYCHYSITSAVAAGLPQEKRPFLLDHTKPLDERWTALRPYLGAMKDTGYARAAQITVRELYGIEEINDDTYTEISGRLQADNTPGLFDRILRERCGIERVLNQGTWDDGREGFGVPVSRQFLELMKGPEAGLKTFFEEWIDRRGGPDNDLRELVKFAVDGAVGDGAVALKLSTAPIPEPPKDGDARTMFAKYRFGGAGAAEARALASWILHGIIEEAGRRNMVVAVHCGIIWNCWNDFRERNPLHLVPVLMRHRGTKFDLYHGGIPWVRETAVIGNQYPNANLNLVWCHQISPYMTENMLNEWVDLVPVSKIIGFAGDNPCGPEKTLGALVMTRENIARALAVRISRGQMSESRAVDVCRMWLYDNPKIIYGL